MSFPFPFLLYAGIKINTYKWNLKYNNPAVFLLQVLAEVEKSNCRTGILFSYRRLSICSRARSVYDTLFSFLVASDLRPQKTRRGIIFCIDQRNRNFNTTLMPENFLFASCKEKISYCWLKAARIKQNNLRIHFKDFPVLSIKLCSLFPSVSFHRKQFCKHYYSTLFYRQRTRT